ncbi:hypothetical protein [Stenotrophomonas sp. 24(2023)]|uniref:hypothetical protein n=1 Tax=Stenotrophomonas sp. 24(2023) TaxID=3068324 RepID=UPI0027E17A3F|nr:hypothetical protein [Stenotrophomonas sp. 24(2023)]WMJ68390.1 hypothetical protein Q9R17_14465 [Stenotrophomonas sp. 24(2023)]
MNSADHITLEDLFEARKAVAVMRSRSVLAAAAGGFVFSALLAGIWLWLHPGKVSAAVFIGMASYLLVGLPLLMQWIFHWRKIYRRLAELEGRVKAGEVVEGAQVSFR